MATTKRFDHIFQEAAEKYGQNWLFLKAQAMQESALRPEVQGPKTRYGRAKGIAQFIDVTWEEVAVDGDDDGVKNVFDPDDAIFTQAKYMRVVESWLAKQVGPKNATDLAVLASYNWGMGNVRKHIRRHSGLVIDKLPAETRDYIHRILHNLKNLLAEIAEEKENNDDNPFV